MPAHVHRVLSAAAIAMAVLAFGCSKTESATDGGGGSPETGTNGDGGGSSGTGTGTGTGTGRRAIPSLSYDPLPLAPPAPRPSASPVASWVWQAHQGDGFSISFPGEPKITELPPDDDRVGYTEAKVDVPGGQVSFVAGYSDHPAAAVAKPDAFLEERMAPPRRGTTEIVHKRSITLGPNPGRVIIMKRNISGTPLRVYSRLYLVGRRLYSLIVSTLETGGVGEDVVKRFMDSFALVSSAAARDH